MINYKEKCVFILPSSINCKNRIYPSYVLNSILGYNFISMGTIDYKNIDELIDELVFFSANDSRLKMAKS